MNKIFRTPTPQSSLGKWLHYIESLSHVLIDLNLDRVRKIATDLDLIHPAEYVILVGGTNGKGTTCCLLETILLNNNNTVGLYTSPHLLSYNERIRICGKELPDSTHIEALSVIESARHQIALTYFEFVTLSALYIFKRAKLDLVILEVGLGGRLDATNVVNPDISVITNIAIDHTDFLGINRDMIAQEKSGIFRFNKPAVIGDSCFPMVALKMAQYCGAILFVRGRDWNFRVYGNKWIWWARSNYYRLLYDLPLPIIPIENAATALSVLYWLPFLVDKTAISHGLQVATLPGRFQIVTRRPLVILDVGHNPHAANYLTKRLAVILLRRTGKVRMVIGMLKNKDIQGTICCLSYLVDVWYCSDLNVPFSASSIELSDCLLNYNVQRFSNILDAWNQAVLDASFDDCILVFGSFHTVSPIMRNIM
ncbi:bifunctional tetrahydrofolate synthase/dihydrofolate synthase [Blochmannia endosymbiont of Camponotus sp.]|uniref:bifunctional tetrahydrofolate synthase/dihydrofolate synthase n=1 Tax=Blochmannia endosymbiont of Camponotus sp. TaxID=700220 RepID=UPI002023FC1E|nr:bifunctional tetrahydrofolate synthase/dihydrofolate synthase [Blochmannia endosymbiont of Camponotus sp.]URJ32415.1 bifunctional tetrahydrofolate synthase/dihydrofolate synthase [Blochmannia endosymbiont of Camponotus sp.]